MKLPRSALPLPRYVERTPTKAGWAYFWHTPSWAKKAGCSIDNQPLGLEYDEAMKRAETVLLPAFDSSNAMVLPPCEMTSHSRCSVTVV